MPLGVALVEVVQKLLRTREIVCADGVADRLEGGRAARVLLLLAAGLHDLVVRGVQFPEHARGVVALFAVLPLLLVIVGFQTLVARLDLLVGGTFLHL